MSGLIGNSGGAAATSTSTSGVNNESGSMNVDFPENERLRITAGGLSEEGDRNSSGGSRWPRQETMALLKIRSDMDVIFRDSTLKGPLWEEVSRKLADLGYHRNAKKCKEKFENVYKYHKRTKDGRSTKQDGKTYRFFDQLEALENQFPSSSSSSLPADIKSTSNQASTLPAAATLMAPATDPIIITTNSSQPTTITTTGIPSKLPNISTTEFMTTSPSTSSSMFSLDGEDSEGTPTQNKKRKLTIFFENLMKEVIQKQETLQKEFLEAIEKYEHQRMVREEQWKMQELARINREHEILIQERSIAAAKDAAVIAFLQKMSSSSTSQQPPSSNNNNQIIPVPLQEVQPEKIDDNPPPPIIRPSSDNNNNNANKDENSNFLPRISSSRWPKVEIEALIKMRTDLEAKYQDNGPKGPLWEEVSTGMKRLGYNRNAKRCKEKWENINKYYKKVKESNKKRPEDSKTCPYFDQLEELYKQKNNRRVILSSSEPQQQQQTPEKGQEQEQDLDDMDGDEDEGEDGYEIAVHKTSMGTAAD